MRTSRFSLATIMAAAVVLAVPAAALPVLAVAAATNDNPAAASDNPAATSDSLGDVSCTSASFCMAVGSDSGRTITQIWNGSTWTVTTLSLPGGMSGVSCLSPDACLAVGNGPTALIGE
jgi:hypothetical protein